MPAYIIKSLLPALFLLSTSSRQPRDQNRRF